MHRYRIGSLTRQALDTEDETGIFYNADVLTDTEIGTIEDYASGNGVNAVARSFSCVVLLTSCSFPYGGCLVGRIEQVGGV